VQWSSANAEFGIFTGTEGWVKYQVSVPNNSYNGFDPTIPEFLSELVWIHWDNPYVWSSSTNPLDTQTTITDVNPPCGSGDSWPNFGTSLETAPTTQLFTVSTNGNGPPGFTYGNTANEVWCWVVDWPGLLAQGLIDAEHDINLTFTLGLRTQGSVAESIRNFYNGSLGLRVLAVNARQPSLRKLFGL
jgi:hypothetical protein